MGSAYQDFVIGEFDSSARIFHLTAKETLHVRSEKELRELCGLVHGMLSQYATDERCYMIVDISKIVIEPHLDESYGEKVKMLIDKFLYPNGLARYGSNITRLTITMGHEKKIGSDPHLFRSKEKAFDYIQSLIKSAQVQKSEIPG